MLKSITHSSFIYYDNKLKWKNCEKSFTRIKLCQNSAYKVCEALSLFSTVVTPQISGQKSTLVVTKLRFIALIFFNS